MTALQQLKETRLLYSCTNKPMDDIIVQAMGNYLKASLIGFKKEIIASKVLNTLNSSDISYNEGLSKALSILQNYIEGEGLFQR